MGEYKPETYYIPTNVTDNGNVLNGNIKKKNAYEAAAVAGIGFAISFGLLWFLSLIPKIITFMVFLMFAGVVLVGIKKGESFFEYAIEAICFKRKQRVMKYRIPRKEPEKKKKWSLKK